MGHHGAQSRSILKEAIRAPNNPYYCYTLPLSGRFNPMPQHRKFRWFPSSMVIVAPIKHPITDEVVGIDQFQRPSVASLIGYNDHDCACAGCINDHYHSFIRPGDRTTGAPGDRSYQLIINNDLAYRNIGSGGTRTISSPHDPRLHGYRDAARARRVAEGGPVRRAGQLVIHWPRVLWDRILKHDMER